MWMFHSKNTSNKIHELHESALRLVSDNYMPTFEELLEKGKSFTVHHHNIRTLSIELYKIHNNLSQTIFSNVVARNHVNNNLHSQSDFVIP